MISDNQNEPTEVNAEYVIILSSAFGNLIISIPI
jgi:hypothetical protein